MIDHLSLITSPGFPDYALLDSGGGRKLERFGPIVVDRPEPQALWTRQRAGEWAKAHALFSASAEDEEKGKWRIDKPVPDGWKISIPGSGAMSARSSADVTMILRLQGLWHLGLFPEQWPHWLWMLDRIAEIKATGETPRVLNLFAYTGAATLLAAAAGAEVTHVDASKKSVAWGRENQIASKLEAAKIRWIVDDAAKFTAREVRRAKNYHIVLVDPPKFGRGPEGEIWDLMPHLPGLLKDCAQLLTPKQSSVVLTVYAIRASAVAFGLLLQETLSSRGGTFDVGELAIAEASGQRAVPTSMFTRWMS
jgi:23S rRNA (cytosine1962-C5)-methyltransferase